MRRKTRKIMKGGRTGTLDRILPLNSATIYGAGGYGLIVKANQKEVFKLFFDLAACNKIKQEAHIQEILFHSFKKDLPEVGIPEITYFNKNKQVEFYKKQYLCGIGMEFIPPPEGFEESVHILLGYNEDDLDTSWGQSQGYAVSQENPTRGFFASSEMMELIWNEERSKMTIEKMAYLMGSSFALFLKNRILPIDVEWIWSLKRKPYIIDFGLCEQLDTPISPVDFLAIKGTRGLDTDIYVPHKTDRGYDEFISGLMT
jgi:hypothetical protein